MSNGICVLAYHRFGAQTPVSVDLPVAQVAEHFDVIRERAVPQSLDEAAHRLAQPGMPTSGLPGVVLTADDGTTDWVDTLLPLLVARNLPMTWYVATRFVEEQMPFPNGGRPVSWGALRDAVSTGLITVGSHTHRHAVMTRLDAAGAADELDRSIGLIEDRLGQPCRHFAYPKALTPSAAADREVRRRFLTAALAGNRVNIPGRTDPGRLGRTPVKRTHSTAALSKRLRGGGRLEGWLREQVDLIRHRDSVT